MNKISRSEAIKISRKILEEAEKERLQVAEKEAQKGISWCDVTENIDCLEKEVEDEPS